MNQIRDAFYKEHNRPVLPRVVHMVALQAGTAPSSGPGKGWLSIPWDVQSVHPPLAGTAGNHHSSPLHGHVPWGPPQGAPLVRGFS